MSKTSRGDALTDTQKRPILALALTLLSAGSVAVAAPTGLVVPPDVQAEVQALEDRFAAALSQECPGQACVSAGCEVARFKTLDQAQSASLPGLDSTDDTPAPSVQYRLEAARCEFAFEPSLSAEAVAALRQRITEKTRRAGVSLALVGRKLAPQVQASETGRPPAPSPATENGWSGLQKASPYALMLALATAATLILIWGFRRLGRPKPIVEIAADSTGETSEVDASSAEQAALLAAIEEKQQQLNALFASRPDLAARAFEPLVESGEEAELCLVLNRFGAEALSGYAERDETAALFAAVRERYASGEGLSDARATLAFLEKVERLATLARLGRGQTSLAEEFEFLSNLEAEEFSSLVRELSQDELVATLAFAPERLRASCLSSWPAEVAEAFARHVSENRSVPDQSIRALARRLQEQFGARKSEIKRASMDRLPLLQQLLNSLDGEKRARVLAGLRTDHPSLFERLMNESVFDGALGHASADVLNDVFLGLDPEDAAAYLSSQPDRERILAKLKGPLAASLKRRMEPLVPRIGLAGASFIESKGADVDRARRGLNAELRRKSIAGAVNLRRLNEQLMDRR